MADGDPDDDAKRMTEVMAKVNLLSLRFEPPFTTKAFAEHLRIFEENAEKISHIMGTTKRKRLSVRIQLLLESLPEHIQQEVTKRLPEWAPGAWDGDLVKSTVRKVIKEIERPTAKLAPWGPWGPQTTHGILESLRPGETFPGHYNPYKKPAVGTVLPASEDSGKVFEDGQEEATINEPELAIAHDTNSDAVANILNAGMPIILKLYHFPSQKERLTCSYCADVKHEHGIDDCPNKAAGILPSNRLAMAVYNNPLGTIPTELDFGMFIQTPAADRFGYISTATIFLAPYTTMDGQVHVVRDYSLLINPKLIYAVPLSRIGSTEVVRSSVKGSILLQTGGYWSGNLSGGAGIAIHDVYYVPSAECNVLSIHALGEKWKLFDNQRLLEGPDCETLLARFPNGLLAAQIPVILGPNDELLPPPQWNTQSPFSIGYERAFVGKGKNDQAWKDLPPHLDDRYEAPASRLRNTQEQKEAAPFVDRHMSPVITEDGPPYSTPSPPAASPNSKHSGSGDKKNDSEDPGPALILHTATGPVYIFNRPSCTASFVLDTSATHHVVMTNEVTSSCGNEAHIATFSCWKLDIHPTPLYWSSTVVLTELLEPNHKTDVMGVEIPDVYFADHRIDRWMNILSIPLLKKQGWVVDRPANELRHPRSGVVLKIEVWDGMDCVMASAWQLE